MSSARARKPSINIGPKRPPYRRRAGRPWIATAAPPVDNPRCKCGAPWGRPANRCTHGHPRPGTALNLIHGARARVVGPPPDLTASARAFIARVVADRGGPATVTAVEARLIQRLAEVDVVVSALARDVARSGVKTRGGAIRPVASLFLSAVATFDRLAARIGLERRAKPLVVPSLTEWIAAGLATPPEAPDTQAKDDSSDANARAETADLSNVDRNDVDAGDALTSDGSSEEQSRDE